MNIHSILFKIYKGFHTISIIMKFYETHYEEYVSCVNKYNIHPYICEMPKTMNEMCNLILYGASGIGKYSQSLYLIHKFSPSLLKYEKKINIETDKTTYTCKISDIHYEVDMSLLGCNSKILWNEIFTQIVDVISMKNEKYGFIICKNFHCIHNELLETFYSYMQQYNHNYTPLQIRFILITEQISFIPNKILDCCKIISMKRPSEESYLNMMNINGKNKNKISNVKNTFYFNSIDNFQIICDNIIKEMENYENIVFTEFRDLIYDILIYNMDVQECLWYIFRHFIETKKIHKKNDLLNISNKIFLFLKYFNNNYRPIYHLENILFQMIIIIHELHGSDENIANK